MCPFRFNSGQQITPRRNRRFSREKTNLFNEQLLQLQRFTEPNILGTCQKCHSPCLLMSSLLQILRKWSGQNHMTTAAAVSRAPIVKYWHQISDKMAKTQTSNTILIVAPIGFCSNLQTLQDNYFMKASAASFKDVEQMALLEFSAFHRTLRSEGVNVVLASNERFYNAPDSCFPNNWFSSHAPAETGGRKFNFLFRMFGQLKLFFLESTLVLYPMKAEARRAERREQ